MMKFLVSADHVSARLVLRDHPVEVREDRSSDPAVPVRYYAVSRGLGCSKSYGTAITAVCELLADHAYTNVRPTRV